MRYLRMTCKHTSESPSRLLIRGHVKNIKRVAELLNVLMFFYRSEKR